MDALPMKEMNSLPFQTVTEAAHNCGHDIHTAMLLAAAQILHERRDELCGSVKLMFQPAEEVFTGSENMIKAGILSNPTVDAAMGIHVMLDTPVPSLNYGTGFMTSSCDGFKITVKVWAATAPCLIWVLIPSMWAFIFTAPSRIS